MNDLKELLRSAAAEAENVSVDGSALIPTIRRRRRVRTAVVGAGGVAAVTTLAVGAYAVLPGAGSPADAPVSGGGSVAGVDCGPRTPPTAGDRDLPMDLRAILPKTGQNVWSGDVQVTSTSAYQIKLYKDKAPQRYVLMEKGGQAVVGRGEIKPLAGSTSRTRGEKVHFTATMTVQGCGPKALPAGVYSVFPATAGFGSVGAIVQLR
ncbi:hypothetical protein OG474_16660 [Kribbella sp. NBC_01505]|uniref:hypothetical protein n=1 Tax=Kribbella sp. NBC_01505 TaxID=2903580 RepID=UPI0038639FA4